MLTAGLSTKFNFVCRWHNFGIKITSICGVDVCCQSFVNEFRIIPPVEFYSIVVSITGASNIYTAAHFFKISL